MPRYALFKDGALNITSDNLILLLAEAHKYRLVERLSKKENGDISCVLKEGYVIKELPEVSND